MDSTPLLRQATDDDAAVIAAIWHQGWLDGHLASVSEELVATRSLESFQRRAPQRIGDTRVVQVQSKVVGFTMVVHDEIEQIYLNGSHRGKGIADVLLQDAEERIVRAGYGSAWLAVVAGNARARRFYEKRGWSDEGRFDYPASGPDGPIVVPSHRYVKALAVIAPADH